MTIQKPKVAVDIDDLASVFSTWTLFSFAGNLGQTQLEFYHLNWLDFTVLKSLYVFSDLCKLYRRCMTIKIHALGVGCSPGSAAYKA